MLPLVLAVLTLSLGGEVPLSTPVIEPLPFLQQVPAVASDGDGFLVVWTHGRWGREVVRAARLDRNGVLLDAEALLIGGVALSPASVASDGHGYLVAYGCEQGLEPKSCLVHVDSDTGEVKHGATIVGSNPVLASNGNGYLVVTQQGPTLSRRPLNGVATTTDGAVAGDSFAIASTAYPPVVASNGRNYLVVWSTYGHLRGILASARAVIGSEQQFTSSVPSWGPGPFGWSAASDGEDFLVAWQQNLRVEGTGYVTDLRIASVSAEGVTGEARVVLNEIVWQPALSWTGSAFLLTYTQSHGPNGAPYLSGDAPGDIHGLTVNGDFGVSQPAVVAGRPGRETASASASNGRSTLVVWENRHRGDAAQIEARFLGREETFVVSTGLPWQTSVAAAHRLGNAVFAWSENAGEEQVQKVFVQRLDASRRPRDGRGIAVAESARHQVRPAMGGTLIAWVEEDVARTNDSVASIHARALDAGGAPFGEPFLVGVAAHGAKVSVASAGSTHLLVWESSLHHIAGAHIDPVRRAGEIARSFEISRGPLDNAPSVVSDGSGFLVVWQRDGYEVSCLPGCTPPRSIHAARVTSWGVVGGAEVEIASTAMVYAPPLLVWNGSEYAVFWSNWDREGMRVRKVHRSGAPLAEERVAGVGEVPLAVAWSGNAYLVATTGYERLMVTRLERDLRIAQKWPVLSYVVLDAGVAVIDGWVAYSAGRARVAARPIGDDLPARRRSTR